MSVQSSVLKDVVGCIHDRVNAPASEVKEAFGTCRPAFVRIAVFSGALNLLSLTGAIYMLQISDRVLTSRSVSTLVGLSLLAIAAYVLSGLLDTLRCRMLARTGIIFASRLVARVYEAAHRLSLQGARAAVATQGVRDLDQVRKFLSGMGPTAFFDFPFLPIFLVISYAMHPLFGLFILLGSGAIVVLAVLSEIKTRGPTTSATVSGAVRQTILDASIRNAEAAKAMGMSRVLAERFAVSNARHAVHGLEAADAASGLGSMAKVFRAFLQSAVLGLGAYLAIAGEITPGAMLAASILTARALAPVEIAVGHWRGLIAAREAFARLETLLGGLGPAKVPLALPEPRRELSVEGLYATAPGGSKPILSNVTFALRSGQGLAIIGPSASGKSTLARVLVGVWPAARGRVCLDGAPIEQWDAGNLGRRIGYLPQDIEMFDGTVGENISRFEIDADPASIIEAARAAGAHEMILQMPQGYDTRVGEAGQVLSAGQRQRVALARALFGEPFLVVLDEPNSNLDSEGESALIGAIISVRRRGGVVAVVTHRPTALAGVDTVAVLIEGRIQSFGPKETVMKKMTRAAPTSAPEPANRNA